MKICAFIGPSGSGKTTLLEKLLAELQGRGMKVAAAKKTHHAVDWDVPGKDSFRLRQAGANPIFFSTPTKLWLHSPVNEDNYLAYVLHLAAFFKPDWLLLEGFAEAKTLPKIVIWRQAATSAENWLHQPQVRALLSDFSPELPLSVPQLSLNALPAVTDFLLQTPATYWQISE